MGVSQRHQHEARDQVWWEMEESMFRATILIGILHRRHMMNYKGTKYSKNDLSSFYPFQISCERIRWSRKHSPTRGTLLKMDDEVTVNRHQCSYIFDAINISFTPHFADDDDISWRLYNDDCEVGKLWGSTHCHWNPSGPGTVQQSVQCLDWTIICDTPFNNLNLFQPFLFRRV